MLLIRKYEAWTAVLVFATSLTAVSIKGYAGTTGAAFLNNSQTPASSAMGMSGVVTSLGASALGSNPAGLGMINNRFQVYSMYESPMEGVQYGQLSAAVGFNGRGRLPVDGLGISVIRQTIGGMSGADSNGNPTGNSLSSEDMAVTLGAGSRITKDLRIGLAGKAIQSSLAGYQAKTAFAGDIGFSYGLSQFHGMMLGLSVNNLGTKIQYLDQKDDLPLTASAGAALAIGPGTAVASVTRKVHENQTEFGTGFGVGVGPMEVRAGYTAQAGGISDLAARDQTGLAGMMGGFNGGLGIRMGSGLRVDYAFNPGATELGPNQKVSLTMEWGQKQAPSAAPARQSNRVIQQPWKSEDSNRQEQIDWQLIR